MGSPQELPNVLKTRPYEQVSIQPCYRTSVRREIDLLADWCWYWPLALGQRRSWLQGAMPSRRWERWWSAWWFSLLEIAGFEWCFLWVKANVFEEKSCEGERKEGHQCPLYTHFESTDTESGNSWMAITMVNFLLRAQYCHGGDETVLDDGGSFLRWAAESRSLVDLILNWKPNNFKGNRYRPASGR